MLLTPSLGHLTLYKQQQASLSPPNRNACCTTEIHCMGSTAKSGGIIAQVRLIHLSLQALAMRSWVASTKTRQMAGVRHRAESSNQEQARMELGPALFPSQSTEKSILLETLLTKKKRKIIKLQIFTDFFTHFLHTG